MQNCNITLLFSVFGLSKSKEDDDKGTQLNSSGNFSQSVNCEFREKLQKSGVSKN